MGRLSILSVGLFILPIAVTVGVLVGLETYRVNHGQKSLFPGDQDNAITTQMYCQKEYGITPDPGRYTFNPNQWGVTGADQLNLCMNVSTNDNNTYATDITAPAFTTTWQFPQGPVTEPVHAFPNAKLTVSEIPVTLSNVSSLTLDVEWSYGVGNTAAPNGTVDPTLDAAGLNANVCVDMFLDPVEAQSGLTDKAAYEVMVWLGRWGPATLPIGYAQGVAVILTVADGHSFDLYFGDNSIGQKVFTWVAQSNTTSMNADINPLINELSNHGGPTTTDHLGYVAFGTEALYSLQNVTLSVPRLSMDLVTG